MEDTILVGVSARKQGGKSSLCNFLQAMMWRMTNKSLDFGPELTFFQRQDGKIDWQYISDIDDKVRNIIDCEISDVVRNSCHIYSFADPLKNFCISVLGLTYNQCYGTDEEKNSLTKYLWKNIPKELSDLYHNKTSQEFISAREMMQLVGTNIMRNYFSDTIWVDGLLRIINNNPSDISNSPKLVLIADVRFQSEVKTIMDRQNSYIIRLTRKGSEDTHSSEKDLDDFDWSQYGNRVQIIDNSNMIIEEKNTIAYNFLNPILKRRQNEC